LSNAPERRFQQLGLIFTAICLLAAGTNVRAENPVVLSATRVEFGAQSIHTTSQQQIVTLSNLQNVALNFSSIEVSGNFQEHDDCGQSIPALSTCKIKVKFQPLKLGSRNGFVRLGYDAGSRQQQIQLSGLGIPQAVTTYHYGNARRGANTSETILKPSNVNMNQFGKLFSLPVDGGILSQPLYVPYLQIPNLGFHNVVFVATQHNSLYAFDADNGKKLWSINLGPYVPDDGCPSLDSGIIATPVIDPTSNTIYLDAKVMRSGTPAHELHAIDIQNGAERPYSPVVVQANVPGTGSGSVGGNLTFDATIERSRSALLLDNGLIYLAFAQDCDVDLPDLDRGWLLAYNVSNFNQTGVFVTAPDAHGGGIWASGGGPAVDAKHDIYVATGNGHFDANQGGNDYGDSVLRLAPGTLGMIDYFTPHNQATLSTNDEDLGSGGIVLLPAQETSPHHLMVIAGKQGRIYILKRNHPGEYNSNFDNVIQKNNTIQANYSTPSYWNQNLYFAAVGDYPKAYSFSQGRLSDTPTSSASTTYPYPGAVTVVSANRLIHGILWAMQSGGTASGNEVLHAYKATNLGVELYNSDQAGTRDVPGIPGQSFESILVANGKVYVPSGEPQISVFGLLPQASTVQPASN
jgi:hypothetical protein